MSFFFVLDDTEPLEIDGCVNCTSQGSSTSLPGENGSHGVNNLGYLLGTLGYAGVSLRQEGSHCDQNYQQAYGKYGTCTLERRRV